MTVASRPEGFPQSAAIAIAWAVSTAVALVLSRLAIEAMPDFVAFLFFIGSPCLLGAMQCLVLLRLLPNAWEWVPVTALGSLLAWLFVLGSFFVAARIVDSTFVTVDISPVLGCGTFAGVGGVGMGLAQWLYLRRHLKRSAWWLLASAIALAIGGGPSLCMGFPYGSSDIWLQTLAIGGILGGLVKGGTLAWLLRQPKTAMTAAAE